MYTGTFFSEKLTIRLKKKLDIMKYVVVAILSDPIQNALKVSIELLFPYFQLFERFDFLLQIFSFVFDLQILILKIDLFVHVWSYPLFEFWLHSL